jgi:hypothetical protein
MYRYVIVLYGRVGDATLGHFLEHLQKFKAKMYDHNNSSQISFEARIEAGTKLDTNELQESLRRIEGVTVAGVYEIIDKERDIFLTERKCAAE